MRTPLLPHCSCAKLLSEAKEAVDRSRALDEAFLSELAILRQRWRVDFDRPSGRLLVDLCFLPQRLAALLPVQALGGGTWTLPLARDAEGRAVMLEGEEKVHRGLEEIQAALERCDPARPRMCCSGCHLVPTSPLQGRAAAQIQRVSL